MPPSRRTCANILHGYVAETGLVWSPGAHNEIAGRRLTSPYAGGRWLPFGSLGVVSNDNNRTSGTYAHPEARNASSR
jgi:hypothetical protein